MDNQRSLAERMRAITISREYGSGGGEIARRLAACLGWQLIDHEVIVQVANALGVSESEVEAQDEYTQSTIARILISMRSVDPSIMVDPVPYITADEDAYHRALLNVVHAAVRNGHVVIVGRGGQEILAKRHDVLHVRIVAALEARITYVMIREGLNHDEAQNRIKQKDRQRKRYLNYHYHADSSDAHLYDLVVNSSVIALDDIITLICDALTSKALRLGTPPAQLGPGAGSTRYPQEPGDFDAHLNEK
ncbi:cytidylate kinase [Ktedonobacteria bacterium brp13]|nr:cytidylate kinase [Ktedonobacteria bacterium brp13]